MNEPVKRGRLRSWMFVGVAAACAVINGILWWHSASRRRESEQIDQEIVAIQQSLDKVQAQTELLGNKRGLDRPPLDEAKRQQLKQEILAIEKRLAELSGRVNRDE